MKTQRRREAIVRHMHVEPALKDFIEAVLALSDDPARTNVQRYLAASTTLDKSRRPKTTAARSRRRRPASPVEAQDQAA